VLDLISPPSGAPLISGLGDIGGFRHDSLDAVPATMFTSPVFTTTTSLDYAELNPATIVRTGTLDRSARPNDNRIAFSTDGGKNWFQGAEPGGGASGGTVAAAADGSRFVWSPDGAGVSYSVGFGSSWTASAGIPAGAVVESDRVDPKRFYGFAAGRFYVSTDGGATFTATAAAGLPSGSVHFKAMPGVSGDVWLAGGSGSTYGLWHSTDSGASFTRLSGVTEADNVGFGKAATGRTYSTLYTIAKIGGVRGIFRSDDGGGSWTRINDDRHQYGNIGAALSGDPRVYGRVYVGTNGRGVIVGESGGDQPPPTTTTTTSPAPPTTTTTTPVPSSSCTAAYTVTNQWQGGFQAGVKVGNTGTAPVTGWTVTWSFTDGQRVTQAWNAQVTQTGTAFSAADAGWNKTIAPGGSADFGFTGTSGTTNGKPTTIALNGHPCTTT
jgi:xyloglucan-specific exo-beta-1,4-glucanase